MNLPLAAAPLMQPRQARSEIVRSIAAIIAWIYAKLPALSGVAALMTRLFVGGFS
jgi:hypothetical protein